MSYFTSQDEALIAAFRKVTDQAGQDYTYQRPTPEAYLAIVGPDELVPVTADSSGCVYQRVGENLGCVVGETLLEVGKPVPSKLEGRSAIHVIHKMFGDRVSPDVSMAFARAQSVQDQGGTWGEARAMFEKTLAQLVTR